MGVRRKLRRKNMLFSGAISLSVSAFIYLIVFWTSTEREFTNATEAAKLAFLPIFAFQAFVLMFLGTGALASGIAEEKEQGLLDYQRMTPMQVNDKIIGYLFGLPVREYFMFAITVPFVGFATIAGGISIWKVLQLYIAFFTSVWLYHLAGMAAGMVAKHPRRASTLARVTVVLLYVLLPQLAHLGITFLGYFTVVPTFRFLLASELEGNVAAAQLAGSTGDGVPFFGTVLSPTLFTLLAQGILLVAFYGIVHRKWRRETFHSFSKKGAIVFFAAVQFLLCGSIWPLLKNKANAAAMVEALSRAGAGFRVFVLLAFFLLLSFSVACLLIHICTPSRHEYLRGIRRVIKKGLRGLPWFWDEASGLKMGCVFAATILLAFALLLTGLQTGEFNFKFDLIRAGLVVSYVGLVVICVQRLREWLSFQAFIACIGVVWVLPLLVAAIMLSAFSMVVGAAYVASPNPIIGILFLLNGISPELGIDDHLNPLTVSCFASVMVLLWLAHGKVSIWQKAQNAQPPETQL